MLRRCAGGSAAQRSIRDRQHALAMNQVHLEVGSCELGSGFKEPQARPPSLASWLPRKPMQLGCCWKTHKECMTFCLLARCRTSAHPNDCPTLPDLQGISQRKHAVVCTSRAKFSLLNILFIANSTKSGDPIFKTTDEHGHTDIEGQPWPIMFRD